jgi:hypothetical protein
MKSSKEGTGTLGHKDIIHSIVHGSPYTIRDNRPKQFGK